ncbi:hypothetical protein RVIR1_13760 [Candidatus Rickettsiella viridis]|uniref:Uncharacterized protein n=1 Tax=Candidatus Rickettsiella viridis TaxID=676208 RepID=A0A2Z5V5Z9_9COXI|nr:hypothetical protein [Candidatus Rickettsiella viridis]BBB15822.1 hypothetical protein RVIR1_13760 [Candidatus Rickettsiella viridis]
MPNFTAHDAVNIAQKQNYKKIIFSFCRSGNDSTQLKIYQASNTLVLAKPVFYTWEKIEEMQAARLAEAKPRPTLG